MTKSRTRLAAKKSATLLIALVAVSLAAGCATTSDDEGQSRDRPTGGTAP